MYNEFLSEQPCTLWGFVEASLRAASASFLAFLRAGGGGLSSDDEEPLSDDDESLEDESTLLLLLLSDDEEVPATHMAHRKILQHLHYWNHDNIAWAGM